MPAILAVLALLILAAVLAAPTTPRDLVTERAALVMRNGVRAPLSGEVPEGTRTDRPWPAWPVAQGVVTPHGEQALEIVAESDRRLFYNETCVTALSWCCLREDFRMFRTDRMADIRANGRSFRPRRVRLLRDYLAQLQAQRRVARGDRGSNPASVPAN